MEVIRVANKLRDLICSHDKAVQQIYLLDLKIADMERRLTKYENSGYPVSIACSLLDQRISVMDFVRDMYSTYRMIKWEQIQMMVKGLFGGFVPVNVNQVLAIYMMEYSNSLVDDHDSDSSVSEEDIDERVQ